MQIKFTTLTKQDLEYIWENRRELDKQEFERQGITESNFDVFLRYKMPLCCKYKGKPVAAFGYLECKRVVYLTFIGTQEVDECFFTFFRMAKQWVDFVSNLHLDKHIYVFVWEGHTTSIRWLKRLGFKQTGRKLFKNDSTFYFMELG